jgi:hypothetical protein
MPGETIGFCPANQDFWFPNPGLGGNPGFRLADDASVPGPSDEREIN